MKYIYLTCDECGRKFRFYIPPTQPQPPWRLPEICKTCKEELERVLEEEIKKN